MFGQKTKWTLWRKKVLKGMRADVLLAHDPIGHLGPEAIVAYVDEEMDPTSRRRAEFHLTRCAECRAEAFAQRGTSEWLKRSTKSCPVHVPESLVAKLAGLEPAGNAPASLSVGGDSSGEKVPIRDHHGHSAPRQSLKSTLGALVRTFRSQNGQ